MSSIQTPTTNPQPPTHTHPKSKIRNQKSSTPARLSANRANAQKSTGPRTPEGKATVSQNSVTHGLLSRQAILRSDPAETAEEFDAFHEGIRRSLQPRNELENTLVERITLCYWRLARANRFEMLSVEDSCQRTNAPMATLSRSLTGEPIELSRCVMLPAPDLDRLVRYESMIDRELHRAMNQLHHLRNAGGPASSPLDTKGAPASSPPLTKGGPGGVPGESVAAPAEPIADPRAWASRPTSNTPEPPPEPTPKEKQSVVPAPELPPNAKQGVPVAPKSPQSTVHDQRSTLQTPPSPAPSKPIPPAPSPTQPPAAPEFTSQESPAGDPPDTDLKMAP